MNELNMEFVEAEGQRLDRYAEVQYHGQEQLVM